MSQAFAYRSLKTIQDYKTVALEVIAVAYERCSFTRLALTEKLLVFWIGGRLREVVKCGVSTVFVCAIIIFWITRHFYYVSFCYRSIFNNSEVKFKEPLYRIG